MLITSTINAVLVIKSMINYVKQNCRINLVTDLIKNYHILIDWYGPFVLYRFVILVFNHCTWF